ncbi:hypothetical protein A3A76_03485 [Candidatus Woesebacteria bacterium RIFCSPLOWO2_01_FULL_39_23]|uniref:UDP-N-acetylmuramyl-tripeptide synthetase n=1 Tax=Candidatus Woesebacteria bacterium RIFCSPHIGHO2_01_FULL_40_22 TaxID=1802499 RepID=A0A1F7YLP5_9BACT|nr:MAG: hypothetical protein A2141_00540 [Candidatus Woesebacteria bacterium RBG_16_40_11]OGM27518.1 MAG: hypothetical protein A2628_01885 [Candidatus Woesebacteria bacterium RIFCSPHIGHO2_01_FULL_40_22]OGM36110.1 MAG: hypothetical protein A3E41_02125 [Candidatus Woesebacteria bacterium RIFCSPHIGHO2_12_FULL_38_9]OGM62692.1 MAG: hypothetical protein A3A76_03485 [Candidatus Woesebacteria bacterium RIFCSPLOWO2_01_FULL_39_23]
MKLDLLLKNIADKSFDFVITGEKNVAFKKIVDDTRKIEKGDLFVAIKGLHIDAHLLIPEAVKKGASIIVGEYIPKDVNKNVTRIEVSNSRRALALLASSYFNNPAQKMKVIGVTGTDGKTTTANLIYWFLLKKGLRVGLLSTISAKIGNQEYETGFHVTNPEPLLLYEFLAEMVENKAEYVVIEVTSHGLDQERVAGIKFDTGVLTNLTHEHLDYHKSMESYRKSKANLFKNVKYAVLNNDDKSSAFFENILNKETRLISYGVKTKSDLMADKINFEDKYMDFRLRYGTSENIVKTTLLGAYNVHNILAATAACLPYGVGVDDIANYLLDFPLLSGRLEKVNNDKGIDIYVDFAHTPNALENVLTLIKKQTKGKLTAVIGCAGERDSNKRPLMGKISAERADYTVFTAEDPRSENVDDIIDQMVVGANKAASSELKSDNYHTTARGSKGYKLFLRIPERGEAISFAINKLAEPGDSVVICGKGHEKSMNYRGVEYPWSDREAAEMALAGSVKNISRVE